ncbi:MAG: Ig-like domain-containing protein [Bacteroidia bacterium]|nr:Ig-like domain-containing protein [Bacteroidia bacterium]
MKIKYFSGFILLLIFGGMLTQCTEREEFFPIDPNKLTIVTAQVNGSNLNDQDEGIKVDAAFTLVFSKPVNSEMAASKVELLTNGTATELGITFNDNKSVMALTPSDSLEFEAPYTLRISSGAFGANSELLENGFELNFTTEIEPKPLFAGGDGTEMNPYQVETAEQMEIVRLFLSSYFVLNADIDLTDFVGADPQGWVPIGVLGEGFSGNFDGKGFTVSGLAIDRTDINEVGLFGVLEGNGSIRNLNVVATGVSGGQATAALVGRQLSGTIENCHAAGSITANNSRVGGLVGSQEAGLITKCSSSCGVFAELSRVGGLVGLSQAGTVSESFSSGNCESLSSRVGGVVGSVEEGATVTDCYSTGNITARNRGGGAFGRLDGTASRVFATGKVTITDADASGDYPGNVVGQIGGTGSASDFFYPNDQVISYGGGADITTEGTPTNISNFLCASPNGLFPNFNFTTVWKCSADGSWMILAWE